MMEQTTIFVRVSHIGAVGTCQVSSLVHQCFLSFGGVTSADGNAHTQSSRDNTTGQHGADVESRCVTGGATHASFSCQALKRLSGNSEGCR